MSTISSDEVCCLMLDCGQKNWTILFREVHVLGQRTVKGDIGNKLKALGEAVQAGELFGMGEIETSFLECVGRGQELHVIETPELLQA